MNFPFSGRRALGAGLRRRAAVPLLWAVLLSLGAIAVQAQTDAVRTALSLPPVYVTATRFASDPATLPFGVQVIRADDIRRAGVATVNEALMKLLGVPGRQDLYGGGDYALDLRGFGETAGSNQVIVLDGVELNESDLGGTRLAGIPIGSVERIEVIRGSGSVLYGEGAAAGVIIITTRAGSGAARANAAQLTALAGSYARREVRGNATVAAGGFSLDVAANRRLADNHRDNFRSAVTASAVNGQWQSEGLRIGLGHAEDKLRTGLPGALSAAAYASNPRQTNSPNDSAAITNRRNTVYAQATLGAWELALDAGWRTKGLRSEFSGFANDYDVDADTQALRLKHTATFGGMTNILVTGLDRGAWERHAPAFGSRATQRSLAIYARDELALAGGTRLSAGLRTESLDKTNSNAPLALQSRQPAWELGVLQPLGGAVSAYARLGRSFRLPNVDEFGFTSPNQDLRVQTSRDAELGARWAARDSRVEWRVYRSDFNDEIGYDPAAPGPFGFGANVNFDPTRRQGVELEVAQGLTDTLTLHAHAALRRATFRAGVYDGKDVPLAPRRSLSLRGEWEPTEAQQVDLIVNHVGPQRPDFENACRMPAYTTLDLRYAYRWQPVELALGVANATDRKYYTQAFGCDAGVVGGIYPEAGRALTASVRVAF